MIALTVAWMVVIGLGGWRWRPPPRRAALPMPRDRPVARRTRWRTLAIATMAVAAGAVWLPLALVPVTIGVGAPRWQAGKARRARRRTIQRAVPDVVDLLVVGIGAGLTPALAVERLARLAPAPFDAAFATIAGRVDKGQRLADALDALPEELGDPARPMSRTLAAAERYGTPLGPALEVLALEARRERRRLADEAARRLPVQLCFPLVGCTLPAFLLLTIAPLVAGAFRTVRL